MPTKQQIKNFLEASMVADALGVPVEFKQRGTFRVSTMQGHGTYDKPAGTWSDDSSLTLCLAENLTDDGNPETLMTKFVAYMEVGDYTPSGEAFDIGSATRQAIITHVVNGTPAVESGSRSPYANGNGALMRIAPLAFSTVSMVQQARQQTVTEYTTVTHGHVRAIIASQLYIECLHQELLGNSLADAIQLAWATVGKIDYPVDELSLFHRIIATDFAAVSRNEINSTGYVVDTLEATVWCALNGATLKETALLAVNLGSDTDTISQIATCLYVAGHLDEHFPDEWRSVLVMTPQAQTIIEQFADRFADTLATRK